MDIHHDMKELNNYHCHYAYFRHERLVTLVEMAPEDKRARLHMIGDFIKGRQNVIKDPYDVRSIIAIK